MGTVDPAWKFPVEEYVSRSGGIRRDYSVVVRWQRNPDSGQGRSRPFIYCNAAHPCIGISDVRVTWDGGATGAGMGQLVLTPTRAFAPVLDADPHPDETFTAHDISFGASIGNEASIQLSRGGVPLRADDPILGSDAFALANLWFTATSWNPR